MEKIWYIKINDIEEGPFSILDLRKHPKVTPDTLVWRRGFKQWVPIGNVAELQAVFADEESKPTTDEPLEPKVETARDELALDMRVNPPYFFWLLFFIAILTYVLFRIYWFR